MNKVITIHLGGTAYQLEEAGFGALRAYLDTAAARLRANPDRDEILSDIERAIGEKLREQLTRHKTVALTPEVETVLAQMGPIEDDPTSTAAPPDTGTTRDATGSPPPLDNPLPRIRRLYRIREGKMIAGVCNGLGARLSIDPTLIRLGFICLVWLWGLGILAYLLMAIVIPAAQTPEEKAAAFGTPVTAQEFIRRARAKASKG